MKKVTRILVAAVLIMAMCVSSAFAASNPVVAAANVSGEVGEEVTVAVTIKDNTGFGSFNLALDYDKSALELVGLADGSFSGMYSKNVADAKVGFMNTENVTGNGTLFTATFKIIGEEGPYAVTPVITKMTDAANKGIEPQVVAGAVTVEAEVVPPADDPTEPTEPADPVDPEEPVVDEEPIEDSADTGDSFNLALVGALALAAVAAGGCTVYARRRG